MAGWTYETHCLLSILLQQRERGYVRLVIGLINSNSRNANSLFIKFFNNARDTTLTTTPTTPIYVALIGNRRTTTLKLLCNPPGTNQAVPCRQAGVVIVVVECCVPWHYMFENWLLSRSRSTNMSLRREPVCGMWNRKRTFKYKHKKWTTLDKQLGAWSEKSKMYTSRKNQEITPWRRGWEESNEV